MEHLKQRARWECRLNPPTPRLANRPHPTPLRKIAQGKKEARSRHATRTFRLLLSLQARNRCLHASLRSVRTPSDFPALRAQFASASFSASCFDSLVWTAWRRAWRPHTDAGNEGRLAKCRGASAGGSGRFGHSLPASPRAETPTSSERLQIIF